MTTEESPKMRPVQHRVIANSDVTLTRRTLKKVFFCNETTIKCTLVVHYIAEDSALITMVFFTSIFTISLGEMIHVQGLQLSSPAFMSSTYMAMIYKQLGTFVFGDMASWSQTDIAKMTTVT
ncbi:hypothetical protein QTO34_015592 [Cnephaeus nilssonii]|uniref:Uncharacterized protein n=1 Tax=Cnephaeus nilssonii TaxID=3371016 RepID=A0AA40LRC2_CNENI|nr:hypothetical protein QTO34_015592 [Eptesicus nilssonii]